MTAPATTRAHRHRVLLTLLGLALSAAAAVLGIAGSAQAAGASSVPVPIPAASASPSTSPGPAAAAAAQADAAATPSASTSCPAGYTATSANGQAACTPDSTDGASPTSTAAPDNDVFGSFDVPNSIDCAPKTAQFPAVCARTIGNYDVTEDDGSVTNITGHVEDFLTQAVWKAAQVVLGIAVFIIAWALQMGLAKMLLSPVQQLTITYQTQVIGALGLPTLCLMIAALICGIEMLFRSKAKGAGEFMTSAVIAGLATTVLAMPATTLLGSNGALSDATNLAVSVSAVSLGQGSGTDDPSTITQPLTNALVEVFEREPNMLLQYGAVLDTPGHQDPCYYIYQQQIQNEARYGIDSAATNGNPINMLLGSTWHDMSGCNQSYATWNQNPSVEKLFVAVAAFVADLFVLLLAIMVCGGLLVAQLGLAGESIWFAFALVLGTLPGGGRSILYRSFTRLLKWLNAVMFSIVFVALFCVFIQTLMAALSGTDLMLRLMIIDACTIAGLVFHRRVVNAAKDMSFQMRRRLEGMKVGGSRNSAFVRPTMMYDRRTGFGAAALGGAVGAELGTVFNPLRPAARIGAAAAGMAARGGARYGGMVARNYAQAARDEAAMGRRGGGGGGAGGTGPGRGSGGTGPGGPGGSAPPSRGGGGGARSSAASAGGSSRGQAMRSTLRRAAVGGAMQAAAVTRIRPPVAPGAGLAGRTRTMASAPPVPGQPAASSTPAAVMTPGRGPLPTTTRPTGPGPRTSAPSPAAVPGSVPVAHQPRGMRKASRPAGSPPASGGEG